jgi:hypothetical protein
MQRVSKMKKIEATGNSEREVAVKLNNKRMKIKAQTNASFGEIRRYGNSELGYKWVQDYEEGI